MVTSHPVHRGLPASAEPGAVVGPDGGDYCWRLWVHRRLVAPVVRPFSSWRLRAHLRPVLATAWTVVDVAVGDDPFVLELARAGKTVFANDIDGTGLRYLKKQAGTEHLPVHFVQADVRRLPFRGRVDVLVMKNLCHHLANLDDVRAVLNALLPLARRLVIVDIEDPERNGWTARAWKIYYQRFLFDDGVNFLDWPTFQTVVREIAPAAMCWTIPTVKGRFLVAVIDQ